MMDTDTVVEDIISQIEKEWWDGGHFGDPRNDPSFVFEVVRRFEEARVGEHHGTV